jgi:hypothetical protein
MLTLGVMVPEPECVGDGECDGEGDTEVVLDPVPVTVTDGEPDGDDDCGIRRYYTGCGNNDWEQHLYDRSSGFCGGKWAKHNGGEFRQLFW